MAHVRKDRVKETTTTAGTGNIALAGAPLGFQTFAAAIGVGNTCEYAILGPGGAWETGIGTLSAAATLQRTSVFESSNGGAKVDFPAGAKEVFVTLPGLVAADFARRSGETFTGAVSTTPNVFLILTGGTTVVDYLAPGLGNRRHYEMRSGANTFDLQNLPVSGGDLELDLLYTAGTLAFSQTIRWKISGGEESTTFADTGVTLTAGRRYAAIFWNMGGTIYGVIG